MAISYGMLKGTVVGGHRAEVVQQRVRNAEGGNYTSNHYHIMVAAAGETWRCPVNVKSVDGSEVWFKIRDSFAGVPILDSLPGEAEGLLPLPQRRPGKTLDFVREPLFDRFGMRHLPKNGAGANDDVQDHLDLYVQRAKSEPGALVYVFGSFWEHERFPPDRVLGTDRGVHDIHMNQGNDPGHRGDDGVFQDGGVIFFYPATNRYVGAFLAFDSQVWFTDNNSGHRLPGFPEGPLAGAPTPAPTPTPTPTPTPVPAPMLGGVRIIAALLNPVGADPGLETVTIFNASAADVNMNGWKLVDRQNKAEGLTGIIPTNQALTVVLTGQGAQLGNNGGSIRLIDPANVQSDVQTYTGAEAVSGKILVF